MACFFECTTVNPTPNCCLTCATHCAHPNKATIGDNSSTNNFELSLPKWVSHSQRRLLQASSPAPHVLVAKDGSGHVKTISEAVNRIPNNSTDRFYIYVKKGEYIENIMLGENKRNVFMYGDGMYDTVVTGSLSAGGGVLMPNTATFAVEGENFSAKDMGFKNVAGPKNKQAVALRSESNHSVFYRCSFDGYQDTLFAQSSKQFYRECDILGTVDFIFGDAAAVFQKCTIRPRQPLSDQKNVITAQGRWKVDSKTGFVIQRCTISALDNVTAPTYLGRPWKSYSTTIYMQSNINLSVDPLGWLPWTPGVLPPSTITYGEFQNFGVGSNVIGRVNWTGYNREMTAQAAAAFTVRTFLDGDDWIPSTGVDYDPTL